MSEITATPSGDPTCPGSRTASATRSERTAAWARARASRVSPASTRSGLPPPMRRPSPPASTTTAMSSMIVM
ncbi:hypothetical protein ASD25_22240 [Brevundimonas sp. Root1423]|nr:hypothetical protein ASD25_22240 [Brevundimonas sp. Root1423]KRA19329.1 hypothetical protein ASD59_12470 [Brevundimonas sp. Root608]